MKHARLFVAALALVVAGAALPQAAEAQLKFGVHAAYADGGDAVLPDASFGLGARVGIDPPLIPFSFWAHGDYYFVDDTQEGSETFSNGYQTVGLDAHFSPLPFPMVTPYLSGGVLLRRASVDNGTVSASDTDTGFAVGLGADIGVIVSGTVQVRYEIFGDAEGTDISLNQLVVRAGITF
jgi:opacity protein-like surface antigen